MNTSALFRVILVFSSAFLIDAVYTTELTTQGNQSVKPQDKMLGNSYELNNAGLTIKSLPHPQVGTIKNTSSALERYVFAHVVQGNFQLYQAEDWLEDMALAKEMGIDAFAINIGRDETNQKQIPLIYDVAEKISFKVFICYKPSQASSVDGLLSWDAWSSLPSPDRSNFQQLQAVGKQYAAPISGLFYKHLSADESGNYIYPTDSWYIIQKYLDIISLSPDFIELLTWNDFGESHYLRDPRPAANLPIGVVSSKQYVDGMPHEPLLDMISYFNRWYKSGSRPPLSRSKAYIWYRPHSKDAVATSDSLPRPKSSDQTKDNIYIFLMISSNIEISRIELKTGTQLYRASLIDFGSSKQEDVLLTISVPFSAGVEQSLELFDINDSSLGLLKGKAIDANPKFYNFNYWSGMIEL
ncbi:hypothetical protein O181_004011 [Austropuccinia psidii MF-1]|uniref:Glycoside hydrolase family 71 protein n=1 Tax=Austropuccinia psidii MF-1 TaxID=1389203 RepID=A0A9Q3BEQ5_9BASI|nr:hypothetical protein [Austropuccinia psidii MF-1]